jgi:hypothetical protein
MPDVQLDEYPTLGKLFSKGGQHTVGSNVLPAATNTLLVPANPNRIGLIIQAITITDAKIVGDDTATAGFTLGASAPIALPTRDAVYMYSVTGGTIEFIELFAK